MATKIDTIKKIENGVYEISLYDKNENVFGPRINTKKIDTSEMEDLKAIVLSISDKDPDRYQSTGLFINGSEDYEEIFDMEELEQDETYTEEISQYKDTISKLFDKGYRLVKTEDGELITYPALIFVS